MCAHKPKFVYYLSAEYLPGRQITQNLLYTGTTELARQALAELGFDLDELIELEPEPALGNGGLGRLAACYLDSLATLDIPIASLTASITSLASSSSRSRTAGRWKARMNGCITATRGNFPSPTTWSRWALAATPKQYTDEHGQLSASRWIPAETILGEPATSWSPAIETGTVNMLRLWRARASQEFDFQLFDVGDYARAAEQKIYSENITKVLYPNDNTPQGRELRLKQEYFFACLLAARHHPPLPAVQRRTGPSFPDKVVIQLNDTHPVVAIPELMRLLVDEYRPGLGRSLGHHPPHVCLHLPHPDARSAGEMAGEPVRAPAAAPPGDHLRDQPALPG